VICERPVSAGNGATRAGVHLGVGRSARDRLGLKISGLGGTAGASLATTPNPLIVMPFPAGRHRHPVPDGPTIGLPGIGSVGAPPRRLGPTNPVPLSPAGGGAADVRFRPEAAISRPVKKPRRYCSRTFCSLSCFRLLARIHPPAFRWSDICRHGCPEPEAEARRCLFA